MKLKTNIKVSAPASIANLACGFEVLGVAIHQPKDEIIITEANEPGIHINEIIGNKKKQIPLEVEKNTAGLAAQSLLSHLIQEHGFNKEIGLNFKLIKNVPVGFGIGSSSASAAAGVMAVNEVLGKPLSRRELVKFAAIGEKQAEKSFRINSVAPSLIGGLVLARDHESLDFHRLPVPRGLHIVVIYPNDNALISRHVRNNVSNRVQTEHAINQVANIGALIHALYMSDLELLGRALEDNIIEKYWAQLIPFFKELQQAAYKSNALGCSIAGTGSGVFAICKNSLDAENTEKAMTTILEENGIKSTSFISTINQEGAMRE